MDYQKHKYGIILLKTRYIKQIKFVKFEMVMKKKKFGKVEAHMDETRGPGSWMGLKLHPPRIHVVTPIHI